MSQELARIHARGYNDGLCGGSFICMLQQPRFLAIDATCLALPLVIRYAKPAIRDRVVPEVLGGKKFSCLAVTEAYAGSDVAGLKCAAQRVPGGWLVNGSYVFNSLLSIACLTSSAARFNPSHNSVDASNS